MVKIELNVFNNRVSYFFFFPHFFHSTRDEDFSDSPPPFSPTHPRCIHHYSGVRQIQERRDDKLVRVVFCLVKIQMRPRGILRWIEINVAQLIIGWRRGRGIIIVSYHLVRIPPFSKSSRKPNRINLIPRGIFKNSTFENYLSMLLKKGCYIWNFLWNLEKLK